MITGKDLQQGWFRLVWTVAAYAALSALVMGANPFKGETLAPMGMLGEYPGWASHSFASPPSHPERSDIIDGLLPGWISTKESIRAAGSGFGQLARAASGPEVLVLSSAKLTPSFLAFLAFEENGLGLYVASLLKLIIAGTGGYLFLRLFLGVCPAFFGGAIYALCGFNAAWFHWPHVITSGWIPWVLWTCAGWYLYRRRRWLLGITGTTAMLILGGFPAVAAYGLGAAVLLAATLSPTYTAHWRDALKMAALVLLAIAAGFLLVAIPLLALSELISQVNVAYRQGGTRLAFPGDLRLLVDAYLDGLPLVERTLYVGWTALLLAIAAPFLVHRSASGKDVMALSWYGLILLLGAIAVTFGLVPQALLKAIPVVGGSLWSRFAVIVGLAAAILAAVGADRLLALVRQQGGKFPRALALTGLAALAVQQLYSQATLFRAFNSIAVAEDFYPLTPTLRHVKANLGLSQSVVADNSYLIGGTLRAYGIPEWFAHGFKPDAEKATLERLVDKPFHTATAARFPASAIRLNGDLYARLGIRYVLMAHSKYKLLHRQPPLERRSSPPMPQNRLAQTLKVDQPMSVAAIGMVFDTYGEKQAPADVSLELCDHSGQVLVRATLEARHIENRKMELFRFRKNVELVPGSYEIRLELTGGKQPGRLGVLYSGKVQHAGDTMRINTLATPGAMLYALYGSGDPLPFDPYWWRQVEIDEERITTLENLRTPKGAYWVSDLSDNSPWTEKDVATSAPHVKMLSVRYSGSRAGYVIVPQRFSLGWKVSVNGVESQPQRYLGMLPAVKVDGPAEIVFAYKPDHVAKGGLMSLGALPLIILMLYFAGGCRHSQTPRTD